MPPLFNAMKRAALKQVFLDTIPVMTGYLILGAGFGIVLNEAGYGAIWSLGMSAFIYAGSCQYLLVELLSRGAGLLQVALATLLVNARHLFYGLSMVDAYKDAGQKKPYLIFALTDETYSLVTGTSRVPQGMSRLSYCFLVSALNQSYWIAGSVVGSLLGQLPLDFTGVEFVLTALFVTMLVEQWLSTRNHLPTLIGLGSTLVCLIIFGSEIFLIPSMALIAVLLSVLQKTGRGETNG